MKGRSQKKPPSTKLLGILAMKFRGTRDKAERAAIAEQYSQAVDDLIAGEKWKVMPPLEDQLPDEWMPDAFFEHWHLRLPTARARPTGTDR